MDPTQGNKKPSLAATRKKRKGKKKNETTKGDGKFKGVNDRGCSQPGPEGLHVISGMAEDADPTQGDKLCYASWVGGDFTEKDAPQGNQRLCHTKKCSPEEVKAIGAGNKETGESKLFSISSERGSEKVGTAKLPQAIASAVACPAATALTKRWADLAEDSNG